VATAIDIIKRSFRSINVIGGSEDLTADMAQTGLDLLNAMLESWSNESLIVYQSTLLNFPLVAGQSNYTIGTGGNFNTTRPTTIDSGYIRWNTIDYPLSLINTDQYDGIPLKTSPNQISYALYVDAGFPLTTLKLFPTPNDATAQIFLEAKVPFMGFTSLTDPINMPPGYERALDRNLAIEIAPQYGVEPKLIIKMMASNAKKWLKRTNFQPLILELPDALPTGRGAWDQNGNYV
jgi:hypothetical protein